jgi:hypothetical protein
LGLNFIGLFVEETEIEIRKIEPTDAILFLFKGDRLIGQGLTEKEIVLPAEVDAPTGMNDSHQVVMTIYRFGRILGIAF